MADALSDRFKLAKSIVGLLLLSLATSLPEVATTLTAAVGQARDLVLRCRLISKRYRDCGRLVQSPVPFVCVWWWPGALTKIKTWWAGRG
ncbi:hypothetical protein [Tateyamaria pelophila]|uniref:hypothetical protein n=1 Tax=Tateyamaria pelophila TaxID=328415 RepID=UPI001CC036CC